MTVWLARPLTCGAAVFALGMVAACGAADDSRSDGQLAAPPSDSATVGQSPKKPPTGPETEVFVCGGQTTRSVVDRYFEDLERALAEPGSNHLFDRLVRRNFSIRDAQGTVVRFDLAKGDAVTPYIISRKDWQKISTDGPDQLQDAGWRGCFLDGGKIWFEASEEDGLRLTSISREVPSDAPPSD